MKDMETGEQRGGRGAGDGRRSRAARDGTAVRAAPRANAYRDAWAARSTPQRAGTTARVAGWVHRRRDHGGLIFIDLRDRSGIVQLVFHPEPRPRRTRRRSAALRARAQRRAARSCGASEGNVNPNIPTGEIELRSPS